MEELVLIVIVLTLSDKRPDTGLELCHTLLHVAVSLAINSVFVDFVADEVAFSVLREVCYAALDAFEGRVGLKALT